jgi:putative nucleotidyltransferase with HDIG domain
MTDRPPAFDIGAARALAESMLANELPGRWLHIQAVAAFASDLVRRIPDASQTAVVAAWLHDIGYASDLAVTGFHPLDGARFLRQSGWPDEICALVAHHTNARYQARQLGLAADLDREYPDVESINRDVLWMSDAHAGPLGQRFSIAQRVAEVATRYGEAHVVTSYMRAIQPDLEAVRMRLDDALANATNQLALPFGLESNR